MLGAALVGSDVGSGLGAGVGSGVDCDVGAGADSELGAGDDSDVGAGADGDSAGAEAVALGAALEEAFPADVLSSLALLEKKSAQSNERTTHISRSECEWLTHCVLLGTHCCIARYRRGSPRCLRNYPQLVCSAPCSSQDDL